MKKTVLAASVAALLGAAAFSGTVAVPSVAHAQMAEYTVEFALGSASLDQAARDTVAQAAASFKSGNATSLMLTGHADTTGSADFNQTLSERRAAAVRDELVAQGISPSAISYDAVGENSLVVPTGDNVADQANRVVTVSLNEPPSTVSSMVSTVVPEEVEETFKRIAFTVGPYYGFNGSTDMHLLGANLVADYYITPNISVGAEQAGFYIYDTGWGGRSVASLDYHFGNMMDLGSMGGLLPYIGVNGGGIYGAGIYEDWIYGPEIGLDLGFLNAKVAWDISDQGINDSTISATFGALFRF
jgi:hypothetical protein